MKRFAFALKARLYALLAVSSIIPLFLAWLFINAFVFRAQEQQLDLMISSEVEKTGTGVKALMDSMKYMSQQIAGDREIANYLRSYLAGDVSELRYLNERIAVFEGSNFNVANITFFYRPAASSEGYLKVNNSLARGALPPEELLFSEQNTLKYYGPHQTASVAGVYPVISLVRKMSYFNLPDLYLYIESGYKLLEASPSAPLETLDAALVFFSGGGKPVYASDADFPARFGQREYRYANNRGWSLGVYIPRSSFAWRTLNFSFGFLLIIVAAIILSVISSGLLWRYVRRLLDEARREEQNKAAMEIKLLMFKINPHFLHNTLNTLKWYASRQGYDDIEEFISSLNRLLLYNMEKNGVSTLQSELDSMADYIKLQRLKYDINYRLTTELPGPMLLSRTPRFVLYPLVENAILHGLRGKGVVEISAALAANGRISIKVADSGPPLDDGEIERIMKAARENGPGGKGPAGTGIGLKYVCRALEAMFPGESFFTIRRHEEPPGTAAEIQFPYRLEENR